MRNYNNIMKPHVNPGKNETITIDEKTYSRYPIHTHVISKKDNLITVIDTYTKNKIQKGDTLVISERIIAIMEGRSYLLSEINPGMWAKVLCHFVTKHPGGIGLKSPWTMQLALDEAGILRIVFAAFIAAITKPLGIKGLFYKIAGRNINAIDGPCDYTLPPGNTSAKLGPKNPQKTADELAKRFAVDTVIIDANDYGVCVMGWSTGVDPIIIEKIFADNPLGQSNEQTPLAIVRNIF